MRTGRVYRITRRGKAITELRPIVEAPAARLQFGCDRGAVVMSDDFDAPVPGSPWIPLLTRDPVFRKYGDDVVWS